MELRQLSHFIAIVDYGSFSKAAREIPISQPALTRSLQNLEASLGVELLERSTRGLLLTPSGDQFYQRAKLILNEVGKAKLEIAGADIDRPQLNMGIAPLFSPAIIPQAILKFTRLHPNHLVNVTSGLFPTLIDRLSEGSLDGVFSNLPFADVSDDLIIEPLFDINVCYVCSPAHPLANKKSLTFAQLNDFPWAVVDEDNSNEIYRHIFASEGVVRDPIAVKTNSLALLKALVLEPPYITLLPHHLVSKDIESNDLALLKITNAEVRRKGGLIYRKDSIASDARNALFDEIRKACEPSKASLL